MDPMIICRAKVITSNNVKRSGVCLRVSAHILFFFFFFFLDGDKISSRAYAVLTQWLSEFDLVDTNGGPFELKYAFPVLFHCQWEICVPIQNTSGCRVPNT